MVFRVFEPFLAALAWAIILVVFFFPLYERLARKWGMTTAAVASTIGVTIILIVPTILIMIRVRSAGLSKRFSPSNRRSSSGHFHWVNDLWTRLVQRFPEVETSDLGSTLRRYGEQSASYVAGQIGAVLRHTAVFLFHLSVTILAMFYLFRDGPSLVARLRELLPFEDVHRNRMIRNRAT